MGRTIAFAAILVSLALAGCAGGEAAKKVDLTTQAPPPTVSEETGSVTGVVVTTEMEPLAGADVGIVELATAKTQTDATGRFTLNDLPPGSYKVVAAKLGFDSVGKSVTVIAGEVANATFTLTSINIVESYVVPLLYNGFIHVGASVTAPGVAGYTVYLNDANTRMYFESNASKGLVTVVDEVVWDSSAPGTAKLLTLDLRIVGQSAVRKTSASPLVHRLEDLEIEKKGKVGHQFWVGFGQDPTTAVALSYEQKFTLYASLFYGAPPAEGFTALPS